MKNLLSRTKSGRRKGSLGLVLDSDAAKEAAPTNGVTRTVNGTGHTGPTRVRRCD